MNEFEKLKKSVESAKKEIEQAMEFSEGMIRWAKHEKEKNISEADVKFMDATIVSHEIAHQNLAIILAELNGEERDIF